jgi:hypothetical protein
MGQHWDWIGEGCLKALRRGVSNEGDDRQHVGGARVLVPAHLHAERTSA